MRIRCIGEILRQAQDERLDRLGGCDPMIGAKVGSRCWFNDNPAYPELVEGRLAADFLMTNGVFAIIEFNYYTHRA
jgi:hypothetical protein